MKMILKSVFALVLILMMVCAGVSINAATVIFDPSVNDNWYNNGVLYGRGIELRCDEAGVNKGNIYATSEYYYYPGRYGSEHFPIFESRDGGKSFEHISDIYEKEFTQRKFLKAEDGTYYEVPLGTEGATTYYNEWWGMVFQPMLYELPEDIGELKKGTVLCVGTTTSANHSAIVMYYSTDGLRTWKYFSTIAEGGIGRMEKASAVWEGYLICEKGTLYCFYSDERGMTDGGQRLLYTKTTDGINWSEDVKICDFEEENAKYRPGMPIVTKLADNRFFLVYEGVNMGNGYMPSYYKISDNIEVWDYKDHGTELPRLFQGGSPYCATMPDGKIVIGSHGTDKIGVNTNNVTTNEWIVFDTDAENGYSRSLFPLSNGDLLLTTGGKHYATSVRKLTCSVERISIDDEVKPVQTTGTVPWGEETPNYGNSAGNATDGNPDTFFDGLSDGYVLIDLGKEYNVSALGYVTRFNFGFRMSGGIFYGSKDGKDWRKIYTIENTPANSIVNYVEIDGGSYRYIKYTSNGGDACNVAEIKVYSSERIKVKMDGKTLNRGGEPVVRGDNILLPLRMIAEEAGADVAYVAPVHSAAIILKGKLAVFKIDTDNYMFDGIVKVASCKIELIAGSTYVPLDVIKEVLQCEVNIVGNNIHIKNK